MFSTIARGYGALQASAQPQSATTTIDRLCDRILQGDSRDDRRAALLGLKGLSRDWKTEVGSRALPILLGVLEEDATQDTEMAKAVVETLSLLCEVEEHDGRPVRDDSGLRNTDVFLATPSALHTLLTLLTPSHFYLRFFSLQLLGILLANRPQQVQQYVLTAAGGIGRLVETLDDSREIIRNESLLLLIALTTQNADIQKLLAFEGAFDKLFTIVRAEGGIGSGGIVVQDCLAAIGGLLRWNVSNQNYFRETSCIPILAPLLLFPRPNALSAQSLATFAFQSWSEQKVINAGLVISLVRMLVGGAGGSGRSQNQDALLKTGLTRCLIELALASNAPAVLKSQSLNALADIMRASSDNQSLLTSLIVTPLIPPQTSSSPETYAGEDGDDRSRSSLDYPHDDHLNPHGSPHHAPVATKWRRGTAVPAVVAVTALAVNGDGTPGREGLRVRAAAANLFTSYVAGSNDTQLGILSTMSAPQPFDGGGAGADGGQQTSSAGSIILHALRVFPAPVARGEQLDSYVPFFAALLFAHLVCHSEVCKEAARRIYFQGDDTEPGGAGDPDDRTSLVGILVGNLMMAQREQAQSANAGLGPERGLEWSRVMVGYLTALSVWLWESPVTVKEFLSEGSNLQVLIQPITQSSGVDSLIQGLCTFLLGICYEFNREPGPITRETLHPILQSRVGPDQFVSRILRLREDPRFRNVGPNALELIDDADDALVDDLGEEDGVWFDFAFVEFLKTNYVSVQRAILVDPHATSNTARSLDGVSPEVLAALRASLAAQTSEIDELREQVRALEAQRDEDRAAIEAEFASLSDTIVSLRSQLAALQADKDDMDREQEDLLVLLEELSEKRRRDKRRLRKAGLDVSDDEDGAEDDDGEVESEREQPARDEAPTHAAEHDESSEPKAPAPVLAPPSAAARAPVDENASPTLDDSEQLPHISPPLAAAPEFAAALAAESSAALEVALEPVPTAEASPVEPEPEPPVEGAEEAQEVEEVEEVEEIEEVELVAGAPAVEPAPLAATGPDVDAPPEPAAAEPSAPTTGSTGAIAPPPPASHRASASSSSVSRAHGLPPAEAIEPVVEVDERNPGPRAGIPPPPRATSGPRALVSLRAGTPGSPRRPGTPQRARAIEPIANPFAVSAAAVVADEDDKGNEEPVTLAPPPTGPIQSESAPAEEDKLDEPVPHAAPAAKPATPEPEEDQKEVTPVPVPAPAAAPAPEHNRRTSVDDRLAAAFGGSGAAFSYAPPPATTTSAAPASSADKDMSALFGGSSNGAHDASSLFGNAPGGAGAAASSIASLFGAGAAASSSFFGGGGGGSGARKHHLSSTPASPQQPHSEGGSSPRAPSRAEAPSPFAPPKRELDATSPFAPAQRQDAPSPFAAHTPVPPRSDATFPARRDAPASGPAQHASALFGGAPATKHDAAAFFAAPHHHQQQQQYPAAAGPGTGGTPAPFGLRPAAGSPFGGSAGSSATRADSASPFSAAGARRDAASPFGAPAAAQPQRQTRGEVPAVAARDVSSLFG
ncbi:hypothetical protein JCM3770_006800 [Rhodotorula araucariae]